MKPAVRISRVRMKNGGADVRVLHRDDQGPLGAHLRSYVGAVLSRERPPDAYAAVALWFDPETPGRPVYNATYCTTNDTIPAPLLVRMAAAFLVAEHAQNAGAQRAIEAMGYETEDWKPDDVS